MGAKVERALIADDDPFFRIALSAILRETLGFADVIQKGSLDEAVDVLAGVSEISLALFDLAMPGMADATSLRAVRECFPHVTTAVVSGSLRREDVLLALDAGVHGFVPKAAGVDELVKALTAIVDGWIYVPPFIAHVSAGDGTGSRSGAVVPSGLDRSVGPSLTPRQRQILDLIVAGQSNKAMARVLDVSEGTVKVHVAALLRVLGVQNRSAAAAWGARHRR